MYDIGDYYDFKSSVKVCGQVEPAFPAHSHCHARGSGEHLRKPPLAGPIAGCRSGLHVFFKPSMATHMYLTSHQILTTNENLFLFLLKLGLMALTIHQSQLLAWSQLTSAARSLPTPGRRTALQDGLVPTPYN